MTFIFDAWNDNEHEEVAIISNNLDIAEAEVRAFGILSLKYFHFKLKEIVGLNEAGVFYLQGGAR